MENLRLRTDQTILTHRYINVKLVINNVKYADTDRSRNHERLSATAACQLKASAIMSPRITAKMPPLYAKATLTPPQMARS